MSTIFKALATETKDQVREYCVIEVAGEKTLHSFWLLQQRINKKWVVLLETNTWVSFHYVVF